LKKDGSVKESSDIYSAKLKRELEKKIIGAKIKIVQMGLIGAEQSPINLTVTATDLKDALEFAKQAAKQLEKIPGASEVKLSSEDGNPEINVKVDREKTRKETGQLGHHALEGNVRRGHECHFSI